MRSLELLALLLCAALLTGDVAARGRASRGQEDREDDNDGDSGDDTFEEDDTNSAADDDDEGDDDDDEDDDGSSEPEAGSDEQPAQKPGDSKRDETDPVQGSEEGEDKSYVDDKEHKAVDKKDKAAGMGSEVEADDGETEGPPEAELDEEVDDDDDDDDDDDSQEEPRAQAKATKARLPPVTEMEEKPEAKAVGAGEEHREQPAKKEAAKPAPPLVTPPTVDLAEATSQEKVEARLRAQAKVGGAGCPATCQAVWRGNGVCEQPCNNEACDWDGGDCPVQAAASGAAAAAHVPSLMQDLLGEQCAPECHAQWLSNGHCDSPCAVKECNYDGGDCMNIVPSEQASMNAGTAGKLSPAAPHPDSDLAEKPLAATSANGQGLAQVVSATLTDKEVNVAAKPNKTLADAGCPLPCQKEWIKNGFCDDPCNNPMCNYDGGDCGLPAGAPAQAETPKDPAKYTRKPSCQASCLAPLVGNGVCDDDCNNVDCGFDGGDCKKQPAPKVSAASNSTAATPKEASLAEEDKTHRPHKEEHGRKDHDGHKHHHHHHHRHLHEKRRHHRHNEKKHHASKAHVIRGADFKHMPTGADFVETFDQHHGTDMDERPARAADANSDDDGDDDDSAVTNDYDGGPYEAEETHRAPKLRGSGAKGVAHVVTGGSPLSSNLLNKLHPLALNEEAKPKQDMQGSDHECAKGCFMSWVKNHQCDAACNVAACQFDGGDCEKKPAEMDLAESGSETAAWCAPACDPSFVGNGYCDSYCNVKACHFDKGDCE